VVGSSELIIIWSVVGSSELLFTCFYKKSRFAPQIDTVDEMLRNFSDEIPAVHHFCINCERL